MDASPVSASQWPGLPLLSAPPTGWPWPPQADGPQSLSLSYGLGGANSTADPSNSFDDIDNTSRLALGDDNWTALRRLLRPQPMLGLGQPLPQPAGDPKLDALIAALRSAGGDDAPDPAQAPAFAPIAASYPSPAADALGRSYKPDWRLLLGPSDGDLGDRGDDDSRGLSAPTIPDAVSSNLEPTYTVQSGDTPWSVAKTHYSDIYAGLGAIAGANGLKLDPATGSPIIAPGQVLTLPDISRSPPGSLAQDGRMGRGLAAQNQQRLQAYYAARTHAQVDPDPLGLAAATRTANAQSPIAWFRSHGVDGGLPPPDPHGAELQAAPWGWPLMDNIRADALRGWQEASTRFSQDAYPATLQGQIQSALDPLGLKRSLDAVDLIAKPIGHVIGGLTRFLVPDYDDAVADQAAADTDAQHPFFLDPHHVFTPQDQRDAFGDLAENLAAAKFPFGLFDSAAARAPAGPLRPGEISTLGDFYSRSVVNDNLEGHELWQHSNIRAQGLATRRLSTPASRDNPVIILDRDVHRQVTKAQRSINASLQTPRENILANAQLLRDLDVAPEKVIRKLQDMAISHAKKHGY